ncbi:MAG TPA: hypothetical protein VKD72_04995 [Gemmataceae bacterium]|nr:hypothetical protein [Gemmataceae bacterium]
MTLRVEPPGKGPGVKYRYTPKSSGGTVTPAEITTADAYEARWDTTGLRPGGYSVVITATLTAGVGEDLPKEASGRVDIFVEDVPLSRRDSLSVTLDRTANPDTDDQALWEVIRRTTEAISFTSYNNHMELLLCGLDKKELAKKDDVKSEFGNLRKRRFLPYNDADAYRLLKVATEAFLTVNCGVALSGYFNNPDGKDFSARWNKYLRQANGVAGDQTLPYLALVRAKLRDEGLKHSIFAAEKENVDLPEDCVGILEDKLTNPCFLELIWSYWHEEGMLVQTLNAISRRFQNIRAPGEHDPLAMMEIDPLRPVNNLLWGYIQDEQHRLSIIRRACEYAHHYGLSLQGKAVPSLQTADNRSKFLEAFHNLLAMCATFFKEDDDTTVKADGFPILNALKDVHLLLSQGAHNQFGDLPSTARQEMLIQEWLLARPEFREFLPTRVMVAYPEPWMDRVDAMKSLQGWTDVSVLHFRNLGKFGEQILLSVRFSAWSDVEIPVQAANWARFWRSQIQGYIHAYRAVTGVDLTADVTDTSQAADRYLPPSVHLTNRIAAQQRGRALPAPSANGAVRKPAAQPAPADGQALPKKS